MCKPCRREHRKGLYHKDPSKVLRQHQRHRARGWRRVLAAYGCRCNFPGCPITDPLYLTIDHVNDDGYLDRPSRKGSIPAIRSVIRSGFCKVRFQLLCFNHNCAKGARREGYLADLERSLALSTLQGVA